MRTLLLLQFILIAFCGPLLAQRDCSSYTYMQQQLVSNPRLKNEITRIEKYVQDRASLGAKPQGGKTIIKIPVVVHILYHHADEKLSDEKVFSQIRVLNECF